MLYGWIKLSSELSCERSTFYPGKHGGRKWKEIPEKANKVTKIWNGISNSFISSSFHRNRFRRFCTNNVHSFSLFFNCFKLPYSHSLFPICNVQFVISHHLSFFLSDCKRRSLLTFCSFLSFPVCQRASKETRQIIPPSNSALLSHPQSTTVHNNSVLIYFILWFHRPSHFHQPQLFPFPIPSGLIYILALAFPPSPTFSLKKNAEKRRMWEESGWMVYDHIILFFMHRCPYHDTCIQQHAMPWRS